MDTRGSVTLVKPEDLKVNLLPAATRDAFMRVIELPLFKKSGWYLAGGTALALHVGHRISVDLDFFTPEDGFREVSVERELLRSGSWKTSFREKGTLYGTLLQAKVSLIAYPFFSPSPDVFRCGSVRILVPDDIASMKIVAVSQRGRKRDFVDLFWYCTNMRPLSDVIPGVLKKYSGQEDNLTHILKSLTYFEDAENDPMPEIFFKTDWTTIKNYFRREVPVVTKKFLGLK